MEKANDRIREFRLIKGMTQKEFSLKCGLELQRLKKIEGGQREAKLRELSAISQVFDVSADYLLGIDKYPHPIITTFQEHIFWLTVEKMTGEEVKQLIGILESGLSD